jgi:hypothetical protein
LNSSFANTWEDLSSSRESVNLLNDEIDLTISNSGGCNISMLTLRKHLKLSSKSEKSISTRMRDCMVQQWIWVTISEYNTIGATTSPLFLEKPCWLQNSSRVVGRKEYIYLHTKFGYRVRIMLNHKCGWWVCYSEYVFTQVCLSRGWLPMWYCCTLLVLHPIRTQLLHWIISSRTCQSKHNTTSFSNYMKHLACIMNKWWEETNEASFYSK